MTRTVAILEENRRLAEGVHVLVLRADGWAAKVAPGTLPRASSTALRSPSMPQTHMPVW